LSIRPRSSCDLRYQSYPLPGGETAVVFSSGIILTVRTAEDKTGLLDIEADRLVLWTRGDTQQLVGKLRAEGQTTRSLAVYLSGNVEVRNQSDKEVRGLRADEVYYDVGRNVAVA